MVRNKQLVQLTSNSCSLPTEPRGSPGPSIRSGTRIKMVVWITASLLLSFSTLDVVAKMRCDAMRCDVMWCPENTWQMYEFRHKSRGWFSFNLMTMWVQWSIIFATWKWLIPLINKVIDHFGWSIVNTLVLPEVCPATVALNLVGNASFYFICSLQNSQPSAIYLEHRLSNADLRSSLSTNHVVAFDEQNPAQLEMMNILECSRIYTIYTYSYYLSIGSPDFFHQQYQPLLSCSGFARWWLTHPPLNICW